MLLGNSAEVSTPLTAPLAFARSLERRRVISLQFAMPTYFTKFNERIGKATKRCK
jgi:hypothetical protein